MDTTITTIITQRNNNIKCPSLENLENCNLDNTTFFEENVDKSAVASCYICTFTQITTSEQELYMYLVHENISTLNQVQ